MGMTDKQFESYLLAQLRNLEKIQKQLTLEGVKNEDLDTTIKDLQDQLKRP
ncbi:MAG: hypothetical protein FWD03_02865 [Defluviitaleaceae bacterium]|nr:hypothetical protein [Defluviitaleaceae bacterium]